MEWGWAELWNEVPLGGFVLILLVSGVGVLVVVHSYRKRRAKLLADYGDPKVVDEIMRRTLRHDRRPSSIGRIVAWVLFVFCLLCTGLGVWMWIGGRELLGLLALLLVFGGAYGGVTLLHYLWTGKLE